MADIKALLKELKTGLLDLASKHLSRFKKSVKKDVAAQFERSKAKFEKWMNQVASGELTPDDLAFLLKSEKDLFKMEAIAKTAETKTATDKFRDDALGLIVSVALKALPV